MRAQPLLVCVSVGDMCGYEGPEFCAMILMRYVRQLMHDYIVYYRQRCHDQPPGKI